MNKRIIQLSAFGLGLLILLGAIVYRPYLFATPVSNAIEKGIVLLRAGAHDGKDAPWRRRPYYGLKTWGIRGSGSPESGYIWFDEFPGATGDYHIVLKAIFEQDGSPQYALFAGRRVLKRGRFPYAKGKKDCEARGMPSSLYLGIHRIEQGEKISIWGESTYECANGNGAYVLWEELVFTPRGHSEHG